MVPPARVTQPQLQHQLQHQLQRPVPKPPTRYVVPLAGGAQEGLDSVAAAAFTSKDVQKSFNNNYQRYVDNIIDSLEHGNACTAALAFERVHKKKLVPEANGSGLLLSKGGKADAQSGDGVGDEQQASPMALMKESILKMDSAIEMLSRKIAIDLYKPLTKRLLEEAKLPFDNQAITLASNLIAQYIIDLVVSTRSLKKRGGGGTTPSPPSDASPIKITRKDFDGFLPYISCLARLPEGVTVPIFHNYKKRRNAATSKTPRKRPLPAQEGGEEQDAQQKTKKNRVGRPSKKFKMESPPSFREEEEE